MAIPSLSSPANYQQHLEKYGYHQVMKVGNRIDISGQGGWDKDLKFRYNNLEEEIITAFENVEHVLNSVNSSWKDVYSVTSYHVSLNEQVTALLPKLFKKYIGERQPLWTCIGVDKLGEKEMNVEIVVTAFKD
ncbi:endoribonuclease L-psp [Pilobolus umbonatus]|nr:endoribonuclease L-psp [Pilobolus umbonatus]